MSLLTCEHNDCVIVIDQRYTRKCPLCVLIEEMSNAEKEINSLRDEVSNLKDIIDDNCPEHLY